jgi:hypothetical protein
MDGELRSRARESVNMKTSLIVVNYNGAMHIERCLRSILTQTEDDFGIVVIDNASTDGSLATVERFVAENGCIRLIVNPDNVGFAKAVNQGIRESDSELIALVNNDAFLDEGWLAAMLRAVEAHHDAAVFASKILFTDGTINSTGHVIHHGFAVMDRGFLEEDHGQYDLEEHMASACAAAALYRRSLFDEVGPFDEDYFMYIEVVDICLRAHLADRKVLYVPTAVAHHAHTSASRGRPSDLSLYHNHRNIVWTYVKDVPSPQIVWELPGFVARNLAAVLFHSIIRMRPGPVLRAKWDALRGLGAALEKRRRVQSEAKGDLRNCISGLGLGRTLRLARGTAQ